MADVVSLSGAAEVRRAASMLYARSKVMEKSEAIFPQSEPEKQAAKPREPAIWFRFFVWEILGRTRDLKAIEFGVLIRMMMEMHVREKPLINDAKRLARLCGTTTTAWERASAALIERDLISVTPRGELWSAYIDREIEHRAARSDQAASAAARRFSKVGGTTAKSNPGEA